MYDQLVPDFNYVFTYYHKPYQAHYWMGRGHMDNHHYAMTEDSNKDPMVVFSHRSLHSNLFTNLLLLEHIPPWASHTTDVF